MDPQQRLLLEETWHCIEDSGFRLKDLQERRTSVHMGVVSRDYLQRAADPAASADGHSFFGSFDFMVANRLSHFFGLRGASSSVDAACASSLLAVHNAVQSLLGGESDFALAGGVNLELDPWRLICFSKARLVSPVGQCKTFDKDADGFVPGEGVAVILLQRLEDAVQTGAHIYGVIRGSAVNHGGKRLSITAPAVEAQREVVRMAIERAGVDAETITYVEAHGTGTVLGDPIEVEALSQAFRQSTTSRQFCRLGSVKTNIGHLSAAAGVVGLIKVLMMFRENKIPPLLNLRTPNPLLNFADSPFRLATELEDWEPPAEGLPLRAGVSAFGAGGVNCHQILEAFTPHLPRRRQKQPLAPFLLSARTPADLDALVQRWKMFANTAGFRKLSATEICSTLLAGRQHFPSRIGSLVTNTADIHNWLEGIEPSRPLPVERAWWLRVGDLQLPPLREMGQILTTAPFAQIVGELEQSSVANDLSPASLLRDPQSAGGQCLWVYVLMQGLLRCGFRPAAIAASGRNLWPALAVAGVLDWSDAVSRAEGKESTTVLATPQIPILDPSNGRLIQPYTVDEHYLRVLRRNIVNANAAAVGSEVTQGLFAKAEQLIGTQHTFRSIVEEWNDVLRAKISEAWTVLSGPHVLPGSEDDPTLTLVWIIAIQNAFDRLNHKWDLPLNRTLENPCLEELLDILLSGVFSSENVIALLQGNEADYPIVAADAQSRIHLLDLTRSYPLLSEPGRINLWQNDGEWLKAALAVEHLPPAPVEVSVLHLGTPHHPAAAQDREVFGGAGSGRHIFLQSLMDMWLGGCDIQWEHWMGTAPWRKLSLPTYAFSRKETFSKPVVRALSRPVSVPGSELAPNDIEVVHTVPESRVINFSAHWTRQPAGIHGVAASQSSDPVLVFQPDDSNVAELVREALGARDIYIARPGTEYLEERPGCFTLRTTEAEDYLRMFAAIRLRGPLPSQIVHAWSLSSEATTGVSIDDRLREGGFSLLLLTQAVIKQKTFGPIRIVFTCLHDQGAVRPEYAAIEGMARCVQLEHPEIAIRCLQLDSRENLRHLALETALGDGQVVRYEGDERWVKSYKEMPASTLHTNAQGCHAGIRPRGVYLIAGGTGGLGIKLAEYLLTIEGVKIAMAGRSSSDRLSQSQLSILQSGGARRVGYFQADISRESEARDLVDAVKSRFGPITGVFQCAGVLRDSYVYRKTVSEFEQVLAPKVFGTLNLDRATHGEALDFFVLFSSIAAVTGNIGQADYAFANAFLDSFAQDRERQVAIGNGRGRTISINWSLWQGGGMRMNANADTSASPDRGFAPMPDEKGLAFLMTAIQGPSAQWIPFYGTADHARKLFEIESWAKPKTEPSAVLGGENVLADKDQKNLESPDLAEKFALRYLLSLFSELLGVAEVDVDAAAGLDEYGIDSILISQFNARIERDLGKISKTILFECRTLAEVSTYLARRRGGELMQRYANSTSSFGSSPRSRDPLIAARRQVAVNQLQVRSSVAIDKRREADNPNAGCADVAIIGMSGRYPMADDLDQFWQNLAEGKDCVSEIPEARRALWTDGLSHASEKAYCKWGGFLNDVECFDPLFFNISPRDAELMDPQERIFLQTAWHAFEDAGYPSSRLGDSKGKESDKEGHRAVGVFVGVTSQTYLLWGPDEWRKGNMVIPTSPPWAIANRVSYWLDLHGPSLSVDTACSSSLTALHLACESIRNRECNLALVGGVNLYLHASKYEWMCQLQMLSRTGKCHAFGDGADGFVPGEGVGALVLKSLTAAIEDGDRIIGVIKGTAANHGGRTNGFLVPSPVAQANLIRNALRNAGVEPHTITYLEAHGTGTSLGDPIEIAALNAAFGSGDAGHRYCALGSAKTNIGHLEAAAGLAGVTKVLLQMRHGLIVPSLHAENANPRIEFDASPFFLQRDLTEWHPSITPATPAQSGCPRRAGVSSFGAGGANAHVVLEEYVGRDYQHRGQLPSECVIVVSAKSEDRLREYCRRLAIHIQRQGNSISLAEVAYQLQLRREAMEERLAIIGCDLQTLASQLAAFARGELRSSRFWWSNIKTRKIQAAPKTASVLRPVEPDVAYQDLDTMAANWADGAEVNWRKLYLSPLPNVSLPGYPFAEERYWIPKSPATISNETRTPANASHMLHPFIHFLEPSTPETRSFAAEFTGREFFLQDHQVDFNKIFPAVAHVEMARAAIAAAGYRVVRVRNAIFSTPLVVSSLIRVHVDVTLGVDAADFEIFSLDDADHRIVYCRGRADVDQGSGSISGGELVDLDTIRTRCPRVTAGAELYSRLAGLGLSLGESYQGVQEVRVGNSEVLSEVHLPQHLLQDFGSFVLHPSIVDSGLQGSRLLLDASGDSDRLQIPFSMGEVEILAPIPPQFFSHVLLRARVPGATKLEVRIVSAQGRVVALIRDFWTRDWLAAVSSSHGAEEPLQPGTFFQPEWSKSQMGLAQTRRSDVNPVVIFGSTIVAARAVASELKKRSLEPPREVVLVSPGNRLQVLGPSEYEMDPASCEDFGSLLATISTNVDAINIIYMWPSGTFTSHAEDVSAQLNAGLFPMVYLLQNVMQSENKKPVRLQCIFPGSGVEGQPMYQALGGLLRTAGRESTRLSYSLLELPGAQLERLGIGQAHELAGTIVEEFLSIWEEGQEVAYREDQRLSRRWREYQPDRELGTPLLRPHGVYLITGGAGGLGKIVARFLATSAGARLVLVGRSPESFATEELCQELCGLGGKAVYVSADIARPQEVVRAVSVAKSEFKNIHGIFHCAGVLRDAVLVNKNRKSVLEVIAPKIWGAINFDTATNDEPLDFITFFASMAGVVGSVGQADYAFANRFLGSFAEWREQLRRTGRRSGRSLAIDWPLWLEGGMRVDQDSIESLRLSFGLQPMSTPTGLAALSSILASSQTESLFVNGDASKLRRMFVPASTCCSSPVPVPSEQPQETVAAMLCVQDEVVKIIAGLQKIDLKRVHPARELAEYGFDSIGFTKLSNEINHRFGLEMTPALFFEYTTVAAAVAALWQENSGKMIAALSPAPLVPLKERPGQSSNTVAVDGTPVAPVSTGQTVPAQTPNAPTVNSLPSFSHSHSGERPAIAIIGMHGMMPQSRDLEEFWEHLENGRNLVTEIPADRWDWREYFGDPINEANKSNSKWGAFLDDVDKFDARFFGISPREATLMDPQQRLFLQATYKAIEEAGYKPSDLTRSKTGLFVGVSSRDYYDLVKDAGVPVEAYTTTGMLHAILANRISYLLNLTGPSFPVDTACSSSLVAMRTAIEALWAGSCEVAITGGLNLILSPATYISFARAGMLSPDGCCKTFDESANGYVRGEGVGAFLLKPLAKAIQDGDHIHAIIRGSAVNHGGRVNTLTTPNPNAQADLIVQAFTEGKIDPSTVGYIEVHGTGTSLGDPIEINGLKKAFSLLRSRDERRQAIQNQCWIGSVKTNIGHLEPAAGVAGLFKVILAMKHGRIPPTLHVKKVNPYIHLEGSPFKIITSMQTWSRAQDESGRDLPRRAGVSSFGFGGANAHIVLEEYIPSVAMAAPANAQEHLFVLSARNLECLQQYASNLAQYLESKARATISNPADLGKVVAELTDIAATLLGLRADEIHPDESLEDLGFDRVCRRQLWNRIQSIYGVASNNSEENNASLQAIARYVSTRKAGEVARPTLPLEDIAYTLQCGREPMEYRLAILASSSEELTQKLKGVSRGNNGDRVFQGRAEQNDDGADAIATIERLLDIRDLSALAQWWARGATLPWIRLYKGRQPLRISLPTYPFAGVRFWISDEPSTATAPTRQSPREIHPLLDGFRQSIGSGESITLQKWLTPSDRIIDEHRIHNVGVLPGVCHLEMARAAIAQLSKAPFRLVNVVWQKVLKVEQDPGREVQIRVQNTDGRVHYEIRCEENGSMVTYSQGDCAPFLPEPVRAITSLEDVRRRCSQSLTAEALYRLFRDMGIEYGPYFRPVKEVWIGNNEALARVAIAARDQKELDAYTLHPTLMDAALQVIAAISQTRTSASVATCLPFAVGAVDVFGSLKDTCYVHAHEVAQGRYDVVLMDAAGQSSVALREVRVRTQASEQNGPPLRFFVPCWEPAPIEDRSSLLVLPGGCLVVHPSDCFGLVEELADRYRGQNVWRIVLGSLNRQLSERVWEVDAADPEASESCLRAVGRFASVFFLGLSTKAQSLLQRGVEGTSVPAERNALQLFRLIKALDATNKIQGVGSVTVAINDCQDVGGRRPGNPWGASLVGFSKTLSREYPHIAWKCLDIGVRPGGLLSSEERRTTITNLINEPALRDGTEVAWSCGHRYIKQLKPAKLGNITCSAFRHRGVYLLVGGARGIGASLAMHLAETMQARLVLVGRRGCDADIQRHIDSITSAGGQAAYYQADVTDLMRMREVIALAKNRFGSIHGVVHGAMVLHDGIVARMDEESFRSVLAPKTEGTIALAELFANQRLDFMLFLSSAQSFAGSVGQGNYAAACAFKDAFARALAGRVAFPVKIINWGFWGTVGNVASASYRESLAARGIYSISPEQGMDAIAKVLASDFRQVVAVRVENAVLAQMGADLSQHVVADERLISPLPPLVLSQGDESEQMALETYQAYALLGRLQDSGLLCRADARYQSGELARLLGAQPKYRRLVGGLIRTLARQQLVLERGDEVVIHDAVESETLAQTFAALPQRRAQLQAAYPNLAARLNLLTVCLKALPLVLSGELLATEVLFPQGKMDLVADVYRGDRVAAYGAELCAKIVSNLVEQRRHISPRERIRILEIGAGTGGTSRGVLACLREAHEDVQYDFTDVSSHFLRPAESAFGGELSNIRFLPFNIEKPLESQDFKPGTYDIVLAAGVMHATHDLDQALANSRRLLKPQGLLVLSELTRLQDFYTVTFGLLDGWWHHQDEARRLEASPLLDVEMWKNRLADARFEQIAFYGQSSDGRELPQRVIVAQAAAPEKTSYGALPGAGLGEETSTELQEAAFESKPTITDGLVEPVLHGSSREFEIGQLAEKHLRELVAETVAISLGMKSEEVNVDRELSSFGVDSIVGVELITSLNQKLGIVLKTIVIFDYPTIRQLADHILAEHGVALRPVLAEPAPLSSRSAHDGEPKAPSENYRAGSPPEVAAQEYSSALLAADAKVAGSARNGLRVVEAAIVECVSAALRMLPSQVDRKTSFSSQGVDSIVGVEIISKLNELLGIVLKTIVIFDYPNVEELAAFIVQHYPQEFALSRAQSLPAGLRGTEESAFSPSPVPGAVRTDQDPISVTSAGAKGVKRLSGFSAVRFERPGSPSDLNVVAIEPLRLGAGEVEVLVKAFPINFSDFLLAKGLYPMMPDFPFTPGVEVAGTVRRIGSGVTRIAVGDAVIALMRPEMGGQASLVITDADFVVEKPANISFEDACGFPAAFLAMYLAFERAVVKAGERVLILGGAGSNGLIAVQLAQLAGAEVFATAGSREKINFLSQMGVHHPIPYHEADFAQEVMRLTNNAGVDVVIDIVGGEMLRKGLGLLAPEGRYIEFAVFGLQTSKEINLSKLINNQTFFSINAKKFFVKHPEERVRYLEIMSSYLASGKVKPVTAEIFPFDRVLDAYHAKEQRKNIGRVVVTLAHEDAATAHAAPAGAAIASSQRGMEIAIIGMSGRFPGADNVNQLWDNLAAGTSSVTEVPSSRWANSLYFDPDPARLDRTYCKSGGFIDDVDKFDAAFFNMSGKEASQTDPQQRLFLEEAYRALEDSAHSGESLNGKQCGVFVGAGVSDYLTRMNKAGIVREAQSFWGNDCSILASRISYFLNLKGPVVTVNTACSSSLVALHLACQSILAGESEFAIAGGAFLSMAPDYFVVASNGNMMSRDGRCKTFDDSADGFGPGEGIGVVVLKPLQAALAEGDHIYGVVRGTAINQDGKTNGITAPSGLAQTEVSLRAYERAGISPETITYVEAHGTGTKLGDPIEVHALSAAFERFTNKKQFSAIGSIKTNIGHAANAAGIAGLIKILLCFKHRQIPPSLNFRVPNKHIEFSDTPFFVNTNLRDWHTTDAVPRRAAISSFGFSGTNAHVILEEPPKSFRSPMQALPMNLFPVSAAGQPALRRKMELLVRWLDGEGKKYSATEIACNLQIGRDHFERRNVFAAKDCQELKRKLQAVLDGENPAAIEVSQAGAPLADMAAAYLSGEAVNWSSLYTGQKLARIPMPAYPFERERHWYAENDNIYSDNGPVPHTLPALVFRRLVKPPEALDDCFQITFTGQEFFLNGHRIHGEKVLPGALYLELACKVAEAAGYPTGTIRNLHWLRPIVVNGIPVHINAKVRPGDSGIQIEFSSQAKDGQEILHAHGLVSRLGNNQNARRVNLDEIMRACDRLIDRAEHYQKLRTTGLVHGNALSAVDNVRVNGRKAIARLRLPSEVRDTFNAFSLHPSLIDGALQLTSAFESGENPIRLLPFAVEEVNLLGELPTECFAYAVLAPGGSDALRKYDVQLIDEDGRNLVALRNFSIKKPVLKTGIEETKEDESGYVLDILRKLQAGETSKEEADRILEVLLGQ